QFLLTMADRIARAAEERSGLRWAASQKLRVYPTVAAFRDATGEPGWVAASTRGGVIRLQPAAALRDRGLLESTVRHEFAHALIESQARARLPLWFREGAALYLTASQKSKSKSQKSKVTPPDDGAFLRRQDQARRAYDDALACFAGLVERFG